MGKVTDQGRQALTEAGVSSTANMPWTIEQQLVTSYTAASGRAINSQQASFRGLGMNDKLLVALGDVVLAHPEIIKQYGLGPVTIQLRNVAKVAGLPFPV